MSLTAYQITNAEIKGLDSSQLTSLLRDLFLVEISKLRLPPPVIHVSLEVTARDKGVDGFIDHEINAGHDWLPEGKSGWQFKTEKQFSATDAANEVVNDDNELKPRIKQLLDDRHAYVLVVGGQDFTLAKNEEVQKSIKDKFAEKGYSDALVVVYSCGNIKDWVNQNPSIISAFRPDRVYYKNMEEMRKTLKSIKEPEFFAIDDIRDKHINQTREIIKSNYDNAESTIIRLVGLTGVGKTRLLYEALNDEELRNFVLYIESPEKLPDSRFNEISSRESVKCIMVIDECPHDKYVEYAKECEGIGGRFTLITLDYDIDKLRPSNDHQIILEPLDGEALDNLIQELIPNIPPEILERVRRYSAGYPRIITLIAEKMNINPDFFTPDNLQTLRLDDFFDQLIKGRHTDPNYTRDIIDILEYFSLFKRIGLEEDVESQARFIVDHIGIEWRRASAIINEQEERNILRKRGRYRYLSPFPLAVHLSRKKWTSLGITGMREFISSIPDSDLKESLYRRLGELGITKEFDQEIKDLFDDIDYESINGEVGSKFFLNLVDANPFYAAQTLYNIIKEKTREELLQFKAGRRNIIYALNKILQYPENFRYSVEILLSLANAENEDWSNNSTDLFKRCFRITLSGTPLPTWERLPYLGNYTESDESIKFLVLEALGTAFYLGPTSRMSGYEKEGLRVPPQEWNPSSFEDYRKSVKVSLEIFDKYLETDNETILIQAGTTLIDNARFMMGNYSEKVLKRYNILRNKTNLLDMKIMESLEIILYYDKEKLRYEDYNDIIEYRDKMKKSDIKSRMERYVRNVFTTDYKNEKEIDDEITKIANETLKKPNLLILELEWLLTDEARNGYKFGYHLGELDHDNILLNPIFNHPLVYESSSALFLSGYLSTLKKNDYDKWNDIIEEYVKMQKFDKIIELIWRTGTNNKDAETIINMISDNNINYNAINSFRWGAWWNDIDEKIFIAFLNTYKNQYQIYSKKILGIIFQYIEKHNKFISQNEDLILNFIDQLLEDKTHDQMFSYYVKEIFTKIITENKNYDIYIDIIFKMIINDYYEHEEIINSSLKVFLQYNLDDTWEKISENLIKKEGFGYRLADIMSGGMISQKHDSLINFIPLEKIEKWLEEYPENAPYILARIIPIIDSEKEPPTLIKYLILKYPENEDIQRELSANWHTGMWVGSRSSRLESRLSTAEKWIKVSEGPVKKWLKKEIESTSRQLTHIRTKEEEEKIDL